MYGQGENDLSSPLEGEGADSLLRRTFGLRNVLLSQNLDFRIRHRLFRLRNVLLSNILNFRIRHRLFRLCDILLGQNLNFLVCLVLLSCILMIRTLVFRFRGLDQDFSADGVLYDLHLLKGLCLTPRNQ